MTARLCACRSAELRQDAAKRKPKAQQDAAHHMLSPNDADCGLSTGWREGKTLPFFYFLLLPAIAPTAVNAANARIFTQTMLAPPGVPSS